MQALESGLAAAYLSLALSSCIHAYIISRQTNDLNPLSLYEVLMDLQGSFPYKNVIWAWVQTSQGV